MPLATLTDAPTITMHGVSARPMAVPSRGSTELAIWYLEVKPGSFGPAHTVDHEEVFVLQEGAAVAVVDGVEQAIGPGDALIVPPGVLFSIEATEPARFLVCTAAGVTATLDGAVVEPPWSR
jgi:mannose-6-phosphate isomerase-like protein (cupin superfamily)